MVLRLVGATTVGVAGGRVIADQHKTDPIGINSHSRGGLMHDGADCIMGQQCAIEFLHDSNGFVAAKGPKRAALMGIKFINGELRFPAFVIGTDQGAGGATAGSSNEVTRTWTVVGLPSAGRDSW
jgi:hypothetical protein